VQMTAALRAEICGALAGEVAHLSQLLGRDLGHWLDGAPRALLRERGPVQETAGHVERRRAHAGGS
jgi:hypothetical protein